MRHIGPDIPVSPDTVLSLLLTAGTGQAFDYPSGTDILRITAGSSLNTANPSVVFNPATTAAALPTTGGGISTSSTNHQILVGLGADKMFCRPAASTGFSLICASSSYVSVEFWKRGG